jgi:hypothetical protein
VTWAVVRSSEREFEHQTFTLWRCPECGCIHAFEEVDLAPYYRSCGLNATRLDLLDYLRARGFGDVAGYDPRVAEGGSLYVQTPDAHHIDLVRAGSARQVLQQPYHRHLATATWLVGQLRRLGFELVAQTHRPYFHTRIPFLNLPTLDRYLDRHGGLTALDEPLRWSTFLRPGFWYRGLTGGFVSRTDENRREGSWRC